MRGNAKVTSRACRTCSNTGDALPTQVRLHRDGDRVRVFAIASAPIRAYTWTLHHRHAGPTWFRSASTMNPALLADDHGLKSVVTPNPITRKRVLSMDPIEQARDEVQHLLHQELA